MTWDHTVVAFNTATASSNRIHDDDVAKEFGFRGGLVPGVDVWAYLVHPCVDRWGDDFLERGRMHARFATPTYDGDETVASLDDDGTLTITNPAGEVCATGNASLLDDVSSVSVPSIDHLRPPDDRPPASEETLATGTTLGTLEFHFRPDRAERYLDDIRETDTRYAERGLAHPGWFARLCNTVLWRSVVLGPWIHVGTDAQHLGIIEAGEPMQVRARVADEHERKGHRFVVLDVVITATDRPVYVAEHTAIWKPRGTG